MFNKPAASLGAMPAGVDGKPSPSAVPAEQRTAPRGSPPPFGDGRGSAVGPGAAEARAAPVQPKDATVLVVEDNVSNFVLIARMLAYMGVPRCEWKTSGWQVVEYADILPRVDLILMDLRLPYEDGYTALAKIRSAPRLKDTIVVAVTAESTEVQLAKAREAGFDGFLGKPLDPDRFPEQVRRLLHGEPVWELS